MGRIELFSDLKCGAASEEKEEFTKTPGGGTGPGFWDTVLPFDWRISAFKFLVSVNRLKSQLSTNCSSLTGARERRKSDMGNKK